MLKKIFLTICILLTLISFGGYFFIDYKIQEGEKLLAAGQQEYNAGAKKLATGKRELAQGKRTLSTAKTVYSGATLGPVGDMVRDVPGAGFLFSTTGHKIKEGDRAVASGEKQVKAGEAKLAAGKVALAEGRQKLAMAIQARTGCLYAGIFFACLSALLLVFVVRKKSSARGH